MTKTEYLEQICTAMGIDVALFPDRLLTTYLSAIATHLGVDIATLEGYTLPQWLEAIKNNAGNAGGGGSAAPCTHGVSDNRTSLAFWYQYLASRYMLCYDMMEGYIYLQGAAIEELEYPTGTQNVTDVKDFLSITVFDERYHNDPYSYRSDACINVPVKKFVGELYLPNCPKLNSLFYDPFHELDSNSQGVLEDAGTIRLTDGNTSLLGMFNACGGLKRVNIVGTINAPNFSVSSSPLLEHDSLMSILNALADKTGDTSGTTWTVTLGSTNMTKLTEEQLDIAYAKGWQVK